VIRSSAAAIAVLREVVEIAKDFACKTKIVWLQSWSSLFMGLLLAKRRAEVSGESVKAVTGASPDLQDSPECDGRFRLPSLLFLPKQLSGRSSGGTADGTKTDRTRHGGVTGLSWER
jgi:hypothetical protein